MVIRIEYVLGLAIAVIVSSMFWVNIDAPETYIKSHNKELEFTDTMFAEVDTNRTLGVAFSNYGIYENKTLTLTQMVYHTDRINLLRSDKGIYKDDVIYLEGNVTLNQEEGFDYKAQKAHYNQQSGMLYITSPFEAYLNDNIVHGKSLEYDMNKKKALGTMIDAVLYTSDK